MRFLGSFQFLVPLRPNYPTQPSGAVRPAVPTLASLATLIEHIMTRRTYTVKLLRLVVPI